MGQKFQAQEVLSAFHASAYGQADRKGQRSLEKYYRGIVNSTVTSQQRITQKEIDNNWDILRRGQSHYGRCNKHKNNT